MASPKRLKGQEVSIRIVRDSVVVEELNAIGSMNDTVDLEVKKDGFLGETVDRVDDILNGYGGDVEVQLYRSSWINFQLAIIARATRADPNLVFNVVRTDFFPNGDSLVLVYTDIVFGAQATSISSRGDFVKVKIPWNCENRPVRQNSVL